MSDVAAPTSAPTAPATDGGAAGDRSPDAPALSLVKSGPDASINAKRRSKAARADREKAERAEATKAAADKASAKAEREQKATEKPAEPIVSETVPEKIERDHWAAKLKGEAETAKKEATEVKATLDRAKREWSDAYAKAKDEIDDAKADADHYKGLFDRLVAGLKGAGFEVDPLEVQLAERDRELSRFKRQQERGKQAENDAGIKKMAGDIRGRVDALVAKYPELDPKKSKDAADYLRFLLTADPSRFPLADLERNLEAFARHQRAAMGAKQPAPAPAQVAPPAPRPAAMTLGDAGARVESGRKQTAGGPRTDTQIKADFLKRRASRAAG